MDYVLCHYGVKGMKWGVRKDARTAAKRARKQTDEEYKKLGATKALRRYSKLNSGADERREVLLNDAVNRLNKSGVDAKQRAKDYQNSLNLANRNAASALRRMYKDADYIRSIDKQVEKLRSKPDNVKRREKIQRLLSDSELLDLSFDEAGDRYTHYKNVANQILGKMSEDNAVVYRTRNGILVDADNGYRICGTDYDVKVKTDKRANSQKFTDPERKKQYNDTVYRVTTIYY